MAKGKYHKWLEHDNLLRLEKKEYIIYMHIFPNNKKYIGITSQKKENRWRNGKGYKDNDYLCNAIFKYGWENIKHIVIKEKLTKEEAEKMEIYLIKKHKTTNKTYGYNMQNGGKSCGTLSEEIKEKISMKKKGKLLGKENSFFGKKHTEETKTKLRQMRLGTNLKKETKIKIGLKGKKPVIQLTLNNLFIKKWDSIKEASESLSICSPSITACCKQKRKTAGKYKWIYLLDEEKLNV